MVIVTRCHQHDNSDNNVSPVVWLIRMTTDTRSYQYTDRDSGTILDVVLAGSFSSRHNQLVAALLLIIQFLSRRQSSRVLVDRKLAGAVLFDEIPD